MDCLSPVYIDDPDEFAWNSYCREQGDSSRIKKIAVPCGHCASCVYSSAQEWRVRLNEEFEHSYNAVFITLTYNDDSLPLSVGTTFGGDRVVVPSVCKRDVQLFLKRLRSHYEKFFGKSDLRYYIVSEYGPTTLRPHYHGLLFNCNGFDPRNQKSLCRLSELIADKWDNGYVRVDLVNPARVGYVTKYICSTMDLPSEYTKPFRLMSLRPAIGVSYLDKDSRIAWHKSGLRAYIPDGSYKLPMPRYYKRHIFSDDELLIIRQLNDIRRQKQAESVNETALYDSWCHGVDVLRDRQDRFIRHFDKKYVKRRKDL